jgi:hypothetical protein
MDAPTDSTAAAFVPPYISFAQLLNVLDRMNAEGVPARVDRSYLGSWSGAAQGQFLKAARSLDLLDEHGRPTQGLKQLVAEPDNRPATLASILHDKYSDALALGLDATQAQLDEVFRNYGISGSTTRKATSFYLHATKFAGIQTSPFFKAGRASGGGSSSSGSRRATRPRTSSAAEPVGTPPSPDPLPGQFTGLHPAVVTLVQALPEFSPDSRKPQFSAEERDAWFAYAQATFNLIYALPDGG